MSGDSDSRKETGGKKKPREYYRQDADGCTVGVVLATGEYRPKTNFYIELETFVEGAMAGFFAKVIRKSDGRTKTCFYLIESVMNKQQFMRDLCKTFGTGGLVCSFNDKELSEFHQFMEHDFLFADPARVKKGIKFAGRQEDGFWVLSPVSHINSSGEEVNVADSEYSWQPIGGPAVELMSNKDYSSISIECAVEFPLESKSILRKLLESMRAVFKHNFIASILSLSAAVYCMHYELIIKEFRSCPIPMLIGEAETGKSTASKTALSIVGQAESGFLMKTKRTSDAIIIERCCKSTLPFCLDDPTTESGIGEILISLCNGEQLANMKTGSKKPKSEPIICANFGIKESKRYSSRALMIPFAEPGIGAVDEQSSNNFGKLKEVSKKCSCAIGWAIGLRHTFDKQVITATILPEVVERVKGSERLCSGYACLLYFARKIVEEAGMNYIAEEFFEFLDQLDVVPKEMPKISDQVQTGSKSENEEIVIETLEKIISWASNQECHSTVLQSIRTGISDQGHRAVGFVLDDLDLDLTHSKTRIRHAIKDSKLGRNNVPKDFLSEGADNIRIIRGKTSKQRKCSIIWLEPPITRILHNKVLQATGLLEKEKSDITVTSQSNSITTDSSESVTANILVSPVTKTMNVFSVSTILPGTSLLSSPVTTTPLTLSPRTSSPPGTTAPQKILPPVVTSPQMTLPPVTTSPQMTLPSVTTSPQMTLPPVTTSSQMTLPPVTMAPQMTLPPATRPPQLTLSPATTLPQLILPPVTIASQTLPTPISTETVFTDPPLLPPSTKRVKRSTRTNTNLPQWNRALNSRNPFEQ